MWLHTMKKRVAGLVMRGSCIVTYEPRYMSQEIRTTLPSTQWGRVYEGLKKK